MSNIEHLTLRNKNYRKVIRTVGTEQLVLMCLNPGEDIPGDNDMFEIHPRTTQFIRVESGHGFAIIGTKKIRLVNGSFIIVPPNTKHYVANDSNKPLKLYTIYSPPHHPRNRIDRRQPR